MVEFHEEETQALPAVMRALAPEMERIGWDRPLGQLTQNDMHRLIVITIEAFRAEMAEIASQSEGGSRSDAGFQPPPRPIAERINAAVDAALTPENAATRRA